MRDDSFRALKDFFEKFPKYKKHELYVAGLSYAGIYIPMLAAKIVTEEAAGNFPTKLTVFWIFITNYLRIFKSSKILGNFD